MHAFEHKFVNVKNRHGQSVREISSGNKNAGPRCTKDEKHIMEQKEADPTGSEACLSRQLLVRRRQAGRLQRCSSCRRGL